MWWWAGLLCSVRFPFYFSSFPVLRVGRPLLDRVIIVVQPYLMSTQLMYYFDYFQLSPEPSPSPEPEPSPVAVAGAAEP